MPAQQIHEDPLSLFSIEVWAEEVIHDTVHPLWLREKVQRVSHAFAIYAAQLYLGVLVFDIMVVDDNIAEGLPHIGCGSENANLTVEPFYELIETLESAISQWFIHHPIRYAP